MEYNWIDASTEDGCKRLEELLDRRKRVIGRVHEILTEFFIGVHKGLVTTEYYDIGGTYHHCKLDASMLHGVEFLDPELQWQQMTPDTKFEDGESLFVEDWHSKAKLIVVAIAGFLIKDNGRFLDKDQISRFFRIPK